jgi:hypothetical protein
MPSADAVRRNIATAVHHLARMFGSPFQSNLLRWLLTESSISFVYPTEANRRTGGCGRPAGTTTAMESVRHEDVDYGKGIS